MNMNDQLPPNPPRRWWQVLPIVLVSLVVGLIPCVGLVSQNVPILYAVVAGLLLCLALPLGWHVLADARAKATTGGFSIFRLSLRILAVDVIVLGTSLCLLGPTGVYRNLGTVFGNIPTFSASKPAPTTPTPPTPTPSVDLRQGLDRFIPADASLALGLSGAATIRQLLSAHGLDSQEKLQAFATCKIDIENAQILLAKRTDGSQMVVVRAQGITDERNLYCLVGVVGSDRMQIRFDGAGPTRSFYVQGLLAKPLIFRPLDATTVGATDEDWLPQADTKLIVDGPNAQGLLAIPLRRIDRKSPLWSAGIVDSAGGRWDLAIDARLDSKSYRLHGTSVPPWGDGDRAEFEMRAPLAFAAALPDGVLSVGIRGLLAAIASTSQAMTTSFIPPPLATPPDAGAH